MPPRYLPVQKNRFFAHSGKKYDQIAWGNFADVILAFQDRIRGWYIEPIHTLRKGKSESAFAVAGLTCLLIDTLTHGDQWRRELWLASSSPLLARPPE